MKKTLLILIIFFVFPFDSFAQEFINSYGYDPFDPMQKVQKRKKSENEVIFYFYEYKNSDLDLRHFKVFHPQLRDKVADKIKVVPPSIFDSFSEKVYAVAHIKDCDNCNKEAVVIMLIGEPNSVKPAYYIDRNMDRNFENDGLPYLFESHKKQSERIKLQNTEGEKYIFWLFNTQRQKTVHRKELTKKAQEAYRKIAEEEKQKELQNEIRKKSIKRKDGFDFSIGFLAGSSNLSYNYLQPQTGYSTTYEVSSNSKGISLGIGYTWKNIQLSFTGANEGLYYWTSYLKEQYGEPGYVGNTYYSRVNTMVNSDQHPENRLSYGFSLAYNIRLGRWIAVAPYANYSWFNYPSADNNYFPIRRDETQTSTLEDRTWKAYGLSLKGYFGSHSEVYVFGENILLNFNPASYFESLETIDLQTKHNQFNFGVGYRYHF